MRRGAFNDPGYFAHRVTLQERVVTADGLGGSAPGWADRATLWSRVFPMTQAEAARADHLTSRITHEVSIRFREDIVPGMRFLHRGRVLAILSKLDPDESSRFLIVLCEEVA